MILKQGKHIPPAFIDLAYFLTYMAMAIKPGGGFTCLKTMNYQLFIKFLCNLR